MDQLPDPIDNQNQNRFNKFEVPPNFDLARFHAQCCKLYKNTPQGEREQLKPQVCPCCQMKKGAEPVSICADTEYMNIIGEQAPLFFTYTKKMIMLILCIIFIEAGQFVFFCDVEADTCQILEYQFNQISGYQFTLPLGFINKNDLALMIQIIVYSVLLLIIKLVLKTKKYQSRKISQGIQRRSVQLTNLSKQATKNDILRMFEGFFVDQIIFSYKVSHYHEVMGDMYKLQKKLMRLRYKNQEAAKPSKNKIKKNKNKRKILKNHTVQLLKVSQELKLQINQLDTIKSSFAQSGNRTSIAFVVLTSNAQRDNVLKKFSCGALMKLLYKLFPSCSKSAIHKKHVTVLDAPSPDDIFWQNLENPYFRTKFIRFSSFVVCATVLIFGMVSEILIVNDPQTNLKSNQMVTAVIVFCINFFIINLLQYSTNQIQKRSSVTGIKLSLIRKITFFMFINISIAPFLLLVYTYLSSDVIDQKKALQITGFQIVLITLSNSLKPFLTLFSVPRLLKWIKSQWQSSKQQQSDLNQIQAHVLFQPLEFPIQIYYSLVHTSLMTMFFYLSFYQIVVVIQLPALLFLFFIAKWMLIKVCKKPSGLSLKLNNLAQSLIRFYMLLYWINTNSTIYLLEKQSEHKQMNFIKYLIYRNIYAIVNTCMIGFMLFSEPLITFIADKLWKKQLQQIDSAIFIDRKSNQRTYRQANIGFTINGEDYEGMKRRIKQLVNFSEGSSGIYLHLGETQDRKQ